MHLKNKAIRLGASDFGISLVKNKKYYVIYNGKKINFGDDRYEQYYIHKDKVRRSNYRKRASMIKNKQGQYTYLNKNYPNYWAYNLLW